MATKKSNDKGVDISNYAARHPRRMYSSMLALGTVLGAGIMAAKSRHDHNNDPLHKLLDRLKQD